MLTEVQKIGHRALFVDARTNLVVTAFTGISSNDPGGNTYKRGGAIMGGIATDPTSL